MKNVTITKLAAAIETRKAKTQSTIDALRGTVHPQELEILNNCRGEVKAFNQVLDAIRYRTTYNLEH
jgi:hypothetical protein